MIAADRFSSPQPPLCQRWNCGLNKCVSSVRPPSLDVFLRRSWIVHGGFLSMWRSITDTMYILNVSTLFEWSHGTPLLWDVKAKSARTGVSVRCVGSGSVPVRVDDLASEPSIRNRAQFANNEPRLKLWFADVGHCKVITLRQGANVILFRGIRFRPSVPVRLRIRFG